MPIVVRLSIVEARELVAFDLPMGFLDRWCHIAVEAIGGFHTLVAEGIEDVVFEHGELGEVG
jgi:hypothetical protein